MTTQDDANPTYISIVAVLVAHSIGLVAVLALWLTGVLSATTILATILVLWVLWEHLNIVVVLGLGYREIEYSSGMRRLLKPEPEPEPTPKPMPEPAPEPQPAPDPVALGDGWIRLYSGPRPPDGKPLPGTLIAFARVDGANVAINSKDKGEA